MIFGTARWVRMLEWILDHLVSRQPDPETEGYLLIGLYQLFRMDNIPAHAAINETVEAAKADLDPARIRFVNGVLRNALRQHSEILKSLSRMDDGVRLSHPDILLQRWIANYGQAAATALCEWNNRRPAVVIRLRNRESAEMATLRTMLQPHPALPECFYIVPPGTAIHELPGFADGAFYVQDPATQMAVDLLELKPGMRVLDACAAPGGKAFACADILGDHGLVLAADLHEDRLRRLAENAERMKFSCVRLIQADATALPAASGLRSEAPFDRILLDVPCSNTGVLNRRPDARWRFTEERLIGLLDVQRRMLDAAVPLLSEGGMIVYSTCSLEPEENLRQLQAWLDVNPTFQRGRQRISLPPASGTDGAFAAQLCRK